MVVSMAAPPRSDEAAPYWANCGGNCCRPPSHRSRLRRHRAITQRHRCNSTCGCTRPDVGIVQAHARAHSRRRRYRVVMHHVEIVDGVFRDQMCTAHDPNVDATAVISQSRPVTWWAGIDGPRRTRGRHGPGRSRTPPASAMGPPATFHVGSLWMMGRSPSRRRSRSVAAFGA
jgi:hypothetical protein